MERQSHWSMYWRRSPRKCVTSTRSVPMRNLFEFRIMTLANTEESFEGWCCADCHTPVHREPGMEISEDRRCWKCKAALFDEAEALLREIDFILMPDRRGRRSRSALNKVQDLVITRRWQVSPSAVVPK